LRKLVASGAILHRFPKDVITAGYKEAMAMYHDIAARNPRFKKVWDDYSAFRDDQNLWFSFAEASLDEFNQTQQR